MKSKWKIGLLILLVIFIISMPVFGRGGATATKEPIKVGAIFSVTGPVSFLGAPEGNTAVMLVERINAAGGVDGHPIELIIKDDQAGA